MSNGGPRWPSRGIAAVCSWCGAPSGAPCAARPCRWKASRARETWVFGRSWRKGLWRSGCRSRFAKACSTSRQGAPATTSLRLASADKANARVDPNQGGLCGFAEGRDKVKAGTAAPTALPSGARNAGNGYLAPSWTARWGTSRLASTQRTEPVAPVEGWKPGTSERERTHERSWQQVGCRDR